MKLLVLAGGFGTRLQPAVADVPKPLAPVENVPFLSVQIEHWVAQGSKSFVFLLHHQAEQIEAFLSTQKNQARLRACEFYSLTEPRPLGTGGAVANAVRQLNLKGSFLVSNADTWLGSSIRLVSNSEPPAMAIIQVENAGRYGSVRVDQNKVVALAEKQSIASAGWINAGLYHLSADLFEDWDGTPYSLENDLLPGLAATGRLRAIPLETAFVDIGVPEDYFRFCRWIGAGRIGAL